jgi:hypothetical protein
VNEYVLDLTYEPTHGDEIAAQMKAGHSACLRVKLPILQMVKVLNPNMNGKKLRWWARNERHLRFLMTQMFRSKLTLKRKQVLRLQGSLSSFERNFLNRCMITT